LAELANQLSQRNSGFVNGLNEVSIDQTTRQIRLQVLPPSAPERHFDMRKETKVVFIQVERDIFDSLICREITGRDYDALRYSDGSKTGIKSINGIEYRWVAYVLYSSGQIEKAVNRMALGR